MLIRRACVVLLVVCCETFVTGTTWRESKDVFKDMNPDEIMDVADFSIYYDISTNETIKEMLPRPWYWPGWMLRLPFYGGPCICEGLGCSCCTGIRIPVFKFDRQTCALLTYDPTQWEINMEIQMNNASVFKNTFSARNPPPFCVPITVPYLPAGLVDMCVRLFDVNVMDQMLHMCMDMDTRIDKAPVLILHFDCMIMGLNGISLSKPNGTNPANASPDDGSTQEPLQLDSDVYDPVTENVEPMPITESLSNNSIKYI